MNGRVSPSCRYCKMPRAAHTGSTVVRADRIGVRQHEPMKLYGCREDIGFAENSKQTPCMIVLTLRGLPRKMKGKSFKMIKW